MNIQEKLSSRLGKTVKLLFKDNSEIQGGIDRVDGSTESVKVINGQGLAAARKLQEEGNSNYEKERKIFDNLENYEVYSISAIKDVIDL